MKPPRRNPPVAARPSETGDAEPREIRAGKQGAAVPTATARKNTRHRRDLTVGTGSAPEDSYTDAEREFMLTLERWKRENRKPFPTCSDVLAVLLSLGYRKPVDSDAELCGRPAVPTFATLAGGDNRPVPLPVWLAKNILWMLKEYNAGHLCTRTPCYAAGHADDEESLRRLVTLAEAGKDPADDAAP